jgi:hypothetical protein
MTAGVEQVLVLEKRRHSEASIARHAHSASSEPRER